MSLPRTTIFSLFTRDFRYIFFQNLITKTAHSFFYNSSKEPDIILIALDDASLDHQQLKWPWHRSRFAWIIEKIGALDSSVIALDIAFIGKNSLPLACPKNISGDKRLKKMEDLSIAYYLRFSVIDKPGVFSGLSSVLAENGISIASVSQEERKEGETVPVIILTHRASEGSMRKAISRIDEMENVTDKTVAIRIEE